VGIERQLEAAIHREVVLGDLAGAMKEYHSILSQSDVPRPVAARALLQTGECMEKLGRGAEAYNSYRRIETEYGDQPAMVGQARTRLAAWVGPRNLNFEEGQAGQVPPFPWTVQAPPKDASYVAEVRRDGCRSHVGCAVVTAPVNVPGQNGNLMQSFSAVAYRGKTVRFGAWLRIQGFLLPSAAGPGDVALIEVADRGIGLEPRSLKQMFQPFFTEFDPSRHSSGDFGFQKRGLGLGLSIVRQFIELHGGGVSAQSTPGEVTRITIRLPRRPFPSPADEVESSVPDETTESGPGRRV
jgi:hypothetical protein